MNARGKLDWSFFNGSLMAAMLVGLRLESWLVFFLALAVLLKMNVLAEEIRLQPRGKRARRRQRR